MITRLTSFRFPIVTTAIVNSEKRNLVIISCYYICSCTRGCVEAGERVVAMNPELIIVHSPHGTLLSSSVALYGNSLAAGSAEWEGHWKEFDVSYLYLLYF